MEKGYIVTIEVFIPMEEVKSSRDATENTKREIAQILAEEMAEAAGYGYSVWSVNKSG